MGVGKGTTKLGNAGPHPSRFGSVAGPKKPAFPSLGYRSEFVRTKSKSMGVSGEGCKKIKSGSPLAQSPCVMA